MPALTLAVLQDGDIDDLEDAGPLDLGHEELDQGTGNVVGDQGAPTAERLNRIIELKWIKEGE